MLDTSSCASITRGILRLVSLKRAPIMMYWSLMLLLWFDMFLFSLWLGWRRELSGREGVWAVVESLPMWCWRGPVFAWDDWRAVKLPLTSCCSSWLLNYRLLPFFATWSGPSFLEVRLLAPPPFFTVMEDISFLCFCEAPVFLTCTWRFVGPTSYSFSTYCLGEEHLFSNWNLLILNWLCNNGDILVSLGFFWFTSPKIMLCCSSSYLWSSFPNSSLSRTCSSFLTSPAELIDFNSFLPILFPWNTYYRLLSCLEMEWCVSPLLMLRALEVWSYWGDRSRLPALTFTDCCFRLIESRDNDSQSKKEVFSNAWGYTPSKRRLLMFSWGPFFPLCFVLGTSTEFLTVLNLDGIFSVWFLGAGFKLRLRLLRSPFFLTFFNFV